MPFISDRKSAYEGDVAELMTDLAKDNFKRGQRGTVVAGFDKPAEAYDLEMEDESGRFAGFAYSVKPDQFINLSRSAFVRAMEAVERVDLVSAERELKTATELRPDYIGGFVLSVLNSLTQGNVQSTGLEEDVSFVIPLLRMAVRVDPTYEIARINLAVAFLNFGVAQARKSDYRQALELFYSALAIKTDLETDSRIKTNIVMALTALAREFYRTHQVEEAFASIRAAFLVIQDEITRRNFGIAYGNSGLLYMKEGRFEMALQMFERAEDSGVVLPDFVNDYGICLVFMGRIREAARAFERVLEMDPPNKIAPINLAKLRHIQRISSGQLSAEELKALANEMSVPANDVIDFDRRIPEVLNWRAPAVSANEFASVG